MSCSVTNVLAENGKESILYKNLETSFGQSEGLKQYLQTKTEAFKKSYNGKIDENGEPDIEAVVSRNITMQKTGDLGLDKYIKKWSNQIRMLQGQLSNNPDEKAIKQREIDEIQSKIDELVEKQTLQVVLDTAKLQLKQVEYLLTLEPDENTIKMCSMRLDAWQDITGLFDFQPGSEEEKQVSEIASKVSILNKRWRDEARAIMTKIANEETGRKFTQEELFSPQVDASAAKTLWFDSSISSVALEQVLDQFTKENAFETNKEITDRVEEVNKKLKPLDDKYGKNKWQNLLLQKRENGDLTGNLVDEFKQEYYDKISALAKDAHVNNRKWKDYWDWVKDNSNFLSTSEIEAGESANFSKEEIKKGKELLEQYNKDLEAYKQYLETQLQSEFSDENNVIQDEAAKQASYTSRLAKWERENSPFLREKYEKEVEEGIRRSKDLKNMRGYKYLLLPKPKNSWKDSAYDAIKADKNLFDFYNFFKDIVKEYADYSNLTVQNNFIPELHKSLAKKFTEEGVLSGLKGIRTSLINSITTESLGDTEYGNIDEETGKPIRELRNRMLSNKLSPEEKSFDLGNILKAYINIGAGLKHKSKIEHKILLAEKLFQEIEGNQENPDGTLRKDWAGDLIKLSSGLDNTKKRIEYLVDAFYGKRKDVEAVSPEIKKGPFKGKHIVGSKIADEIIQWTQIKGLGLNVFSGVTNLMFGMVANTLHAANGQEFTDREHLKGLKIMAESIFRKKNREKVATLMDKFQVMGDINLANYGGHSGFDKAYFMQKLGEHFVQGNVMVSMMLHTKVKDIHGNDSDLFNAFDEKGILKPNFKNLSFEDESTREFKDFAAKIQQTVKYIHGNYDINSPTLIKKKVWGRLIMQFRNWIPMTIFNRFGSQFDDYRLGRAKKGRYITYKDLGISKSLSTLIKLSFGQKVDISDIDKANMRENLRELAMMATFTLVSIMLRGLYKGYKKDKDDKDAAIFSYLYNNARRTEQDLWFFISPVQFNNLFENAIPATKTVADFLNVINASGKLIIGQDTIEHGRNKGKSNIARAIRKAIPIVNQPDRIIGLTQTLNK